MVLGNIGERRSYVRRLAGNLDDSDITNTELDVIINRNDNNIMNLTGQFDWKSSDQKFQSVLLASDLNSSSDVLLGIPTNEAKIAAADNRKAARETIQSINEKDEDQGTAEEPNVSVSTGHEQID